MTRLSNQPAFLFSKKEEPNLKKLKTRIVSAFLVLMTLLTLLPTTAFAAVSTGTGIKATTDPNNWTTRLTSDGTPYSYRPPMAAGRMLYCCDFGYGYWNFLHAALHLGTPIP